MLQFNGILLVKKPAGITSHDLVYRARKLLGIKSIGHAGTLDPMATGLMILLVGDGTKISNWVLNGNKSYTAGIKLGVVTDTWDITGQVLKEQPVDKSKTLVEEKILNLSGVLDLPVPSYSAVKKDGKKLYELARKGAEVPELRRSMNFYRVEPIEIGLDRMLVHLSCSKGSYIRSWAYQLGESLDCGACLDSLERTESSPYFLKDALSIEEISELIASDEKSAAIIPMENCLPSWPKITVSGRDEKLLSNGAISDSLQSRLKMVDLAGVSSGRVKDQERFDQGIKVFSASDKKLMSLLVAKDNYSYKIAKVFH